MHIIYWCTHLHVFNSYNLVRYENFEHKTPSKRHFCSLRALQFFDYIDSIDIVSYLEDFYSTNLSSFDYDPWKVGSKNITNINQDMVDIDEIISHTRSPSRRVNMRFHVTWSDCD